MPIQPDIKLKLRNFSSVLHKAVLLTLVAFLQQCSYSQDQSTKQLTMKTNGEKSQHNPIYSRTDTNSVELNEEEWKKLLPPEVYHIARQKGTERPWTSPYETSTDIGTYYCAACGNPLFVSDTKFESGCGWPSFYQPVSKGSVRYEPDHSHGMNRTEVMCGRCKSHLGHVFEDGPPPTGLRYCINGVVLDFEKAKEAEKNFEAR